MNTLFISYESICLIFFLLLGCYALSRFMLCKLTELSLKIRLIPDDELFQRFQNLSEDYEKKPTFWKGQECREIFEEITKRQLPGKISDELLIDKFREVSGCYEKHQTFWRKKELSVLQEEMKKRKLL